MGQKKHSSKQIAPVTYTLRKNLEVCFAGLPQRWKKAGKAEKAEKWT